MKPIIDVSHHNGHLDWEIIKDQIDSAIIRIGYRGYGVNGGIVKDKEFNYNESECYRLVIPREYYFFPTDITVSECAESAIWLCHNLLIYKDLPITIWLDSEYSKSNKRGRSDNLSKAHRTNMLMELRNFLRTLMPTWNIGIYASESWFKERLDYTVLKENDVPLWVAHWNKEPKLPYKYWQYRNNGSLKGCNCSFDFSARPGEKI